MTDGAVRLALTVGDPGGIGPEISAALLAGTALEGTETYIIGSAAALEKELPVSLRGGYEVVAPESGGLASPSSFPVIVDTGDEREVPLGRPSAAGGRVSGRALEEAVRLAREGIVEGIVTGPISKEALRLAGYPYRGHTEMLADMLGAPDCQMMMVDGALRVVILTRDIPLKEVPAEITAPRIKTCVRVTAEALRGMWDIEEPRLAVAALNPHAGDGGVTGTEERDIIIPALEDLLAEGYAVEGPLPADTMFCRWEERGFDVFVALYHDQGMIPFKMRGFERGVNTTIGLPVVRTSVCHGTAFDIAGQGVSDPGSLEEAVSLAVSCCLAGRMRDREEAPHRRKGGRKSPASPQESRSGRTGKKG